MYLIDVSDSLSSTNEEGHSPLGDSKSLVDSENSSVEVTYRRLMSPVGTTMVSGSWGRHNGVDNQFPDIGNKYNADPHKNIRIDSSLLNSFGFRTSNKNPFRDGKSYEWHFIC